MYSIPNFEIGLWNAWIFMLYHQLLCIVLLGSKGLLIKSSAAITHKKTSRVSRSVKIIKILRETPPAG